MFGVTNLAPCAMLLSKAGTLICKLSAERFTFSNSGSLTRKLICFGSLRFGFLSAEVSSKISRSLNVPPPVFLHCCSERIERQNASGCCLSYSLRGLASSMFASHFVAQTTLLGACFASPKPPVKAVKTCPF